MRASFITLYFVSFPITILLMAAMQPVLARPLSAGEKLTEQLPSLSSDAVELKPLLQQSSPPNGGEGFDQQVTPQVNRYLLGPGDVINVTIPRPPGPYRLGTGDTISVTVERFPDLNFQSFINPEGNITVPLLGTVSLQGLTLAEAQEKIRVALDRFVIDPVIVLSLIGLRPDSSFQAQIDPEGNIVVPQVGTVSLQGLSLNEAQEKIRLSLSGVLVEPMLEVSLATPRPVQVSISGEVFRPGIYPLSSPIPRVADALFIAGGSTQRADLRQIKVRRRLVDGSVISQTVDLYAVLQNNGSIPSLRLQDGDAIIVPRQEVGTDDGYDRNLVARSSLAVPQIRVRILNYTNSGVVTQTLPNGSNFIDVLGGINLDRANLQDIALVRFDAEQGRAVTQRLNARKALAGDASQNVPLQDNDVIVVGRNLVGRISNLLTTITQPFFNVQSFINFLENFGGGR